MATAQARNHQTVEAQVTYQPNRHRLRIQQTTQKTGLIGGLSYAYVDVASSTLYWFYNR
jgi:hypothetical protein